MTDRKISQLTAATSLSDTDEFAIASSGTSKKITGANLLASVPSWRVVKAITGAEWDAAVGSGQIAIFTPVAGQIVDDFAITLPSADSGLNVSVNGGYIGPFFLPYPGGGGVYTGKEYIYGVTQLDRGSGLGGGLVGAALSHAQFYGSPPGVLNVPSSDQDPQTDARQAQDHYGLPIFVTATTQTVYAIISGPASGSSWTDTLNVWARIQDQGAIL